MKKYKIFALTIISLCLILIITACDKKTDKTSVSGKVVTDPSQIIEIIEQLITKTAQGLNWPEKNFYKPGKTYFYSIEETLANCRHNKYGTYRNIDTLQSYVMGYWITKDNPENKDGCKMLGAEKESIETGIKEFNARHERCWQSLPDCDEWSCSTGPYRAYADYVVLEVGEFHFFVNIKKQGGITCTSGVIENSEDIAIPLINNIKKHYKNGAWVE